MIIGITGPMASGKGEAVKILEAEGFRHMTLSDGLRREATERGLSHTRENLQNLGNEMRKKFGAGALAKKVLEEIQKSGYKNWVIDGIRNPAEIAELKKIKDTTVVGIHADREVLIQRILSRKREGDSVARPEIEKLLDRELGVGEPEDGQQVGKCMRMVDHLIVNEGAMKEFEAKILAIVIGSKN
jgi:dephospho-CoA kinase